MTTYQMSLKHAEMHNAKLARKADAAKAPRADDFTFAVDAPRANRTAKADDFDFNPAK